jgi:hypothetical protein
VGGGGGGGGRGGWGGGPAPPRRQEERLRQSRAPAKPREWAGEEGGGSRLHLQHLRRGEGGRERRGRLAATRGREGGEDWIGSDAETETGTGRGSRLVVVRPACQLLSGLLVGWAVLGLRSGTSCVLSFSRFLRINYKPIT